MRRLFVLACGILAIATFVLAGLPGVIALDWHGTHLYVLSPMSVSMYDATGRTRLTTTQLPRGFAAAGIVTRKLGDHEHVFVSGFYGREGMVYDYETITADQPDRYSTPDQAAGVDFGKRNGRPGLFVASAVTNSIYFMDLDLRGTAKPVAYVPAAAAIGPIIFDPLRNHLIVGDTGRSAIFDIDVATGKYRSILASKIARPASFAFDETFSTLYVADSRAGRIHVLRADPSGSWVVRDSISVDSRGISSLALGPRNTLFVGDTSARVYQLSLATRTRSLLFQLFQYHQ